MENPYWLAITQPNFDYVGRILAFVAAYATTFVTADYIVSRSSSGSALHPLSSPRGGAKPPQPARSGVTAASNLCAIIHASVTSLASIFVVFRLSTGPDVDGSVARLWSWTLSFSQGYFIADALLYGTRRESWVLAHHGWMALAHHPIGELAKGCALMGCGDCSRAVWLSATGYWAEISTVLLNIRWFQHRWMQKQSFWYTLNSALLVVVYPATRVVSVPFILGGSLWPHWAEYRRNGLGGLVVFTTVTYAALTCMSSYYYYTLVRKGLGRVLTFSPGREKNE